MKSFNWFLILVTFVLLNSFLSGCEGPRYYNSTELSQAQALDSLNILILEEPFSFQKTNSLAKGLDYELLTDFAEYYKIPINFISYKNQDDLIADFNSGKGQLAAGRFPKALAINNHFQTGPDYEAGSLTLYCHESLKIQKIEDLNSSKKPTRPILRITTFEKFKDLIPYKKLQERLPYTEFEVWVNGSSKQAFKDIESKGTDCLLVNSLEGQFYEKKFPSIKKVTRLLDHFSLNWMIQKNHSYLNSLLKYWFQISSRNGHILKVYDKYRIFSQELSIQDIQTFIKRTESRLPEFIKLFKKASSEFNIPWQLIAAISYQESHWDNSAVSFTGVKGVMQITRSTAEDLGINDIHNTEESILGGAKYLKQLIRKMPRHLKKEDKIILALAAYNIGIGHLNDAFNIAFQQNRNPYQWPHLRKVLPLLTEETHFKNTKFGEARGHETVAFVERTKSFYYYLLNQK